MENAYIRLADYVRRKIKAAEYAPNDYIPSEKALCEATSLGRSTVRKGLSLLVNEGLLVPVQGKGYRVCSPKTEEYTLFFNETNALETGGDDVIIINVSVLTDNERIRNLLELLPTQSIVLIERIIISNGEYAAYDCKYMPYSAKEPIVEREILKASTPEIFSINKSLFGIDTKMKIRIGDINEKEAKILRCEAGEPAIVFDMLTTDKNGVVMGYSHTKFLGKFLRLNAV